MNPVEGSPATANRANVSRLHLRYPGTCAVCGITLAVGVEALYDVTTRSVRCIACPEGEQAANERIEAGIAGASAEREYERRVASRDARTKDRFGRRLGGVILALTDEPASTRAWATGARGEQELAAALAGMDGISVLHDRRVPGTRGNIDHLVIAPAGVFVVDAKRYDGLIRVRDVGGLLKTDERLYVGRRDCSTLADNMGWQVEAVVRILQSVTAQPPPVIPILCFVHGEWPLLRPPSSFRGVRLESERSIRTLVMRSQILDSGVIELLAHCLASALPPK